MPLSSELLNALGATPAHLTERLGPVRPALFTVRSKPAAFCVTEHLCHLADLEEEGYGPRIQRLLREEHPTLADFDGDRLAKERDYLSKDPRQAAHRFASARTKNVETLRALSDEQLARAGEQEHVGTVTLRHVAEAMLGHDRAHLAELDELLAALKAP